MKPVYWEKDGVLYKKENENQKMKMGGGSWTINIDKYDISKYEKIVYVTRENSYSISTVDAFEKGFVLPFKGENKLVVPIKNWAITKVR